jgi:hypothetical protein
MMADITSERRTQWWCILASQYGVITGKNPTLDVILEVLRSFECFYNGFYCVAFTKGLIVE